MFPRPSKFSSPLTAHLSVLFSFTATPHTLLTILRPSRLVRGQLDTDESGYIITKPGTTTTSVKGVFAAGDVQDKVFRQAILSFIALKLSLLNL